MAASKYAGKVPSFEVVLADSSAHMGAAIIIQDALRQIGLDMQIKPVSGPAFDDIAWKHRALDVSIHSMGPWWNDFMYWAYWMYRIGLGDEPHPVQERDAGSIRRQGAADSAGAGRRVPQAAETGARV